MKSVWWRGNGKRVTMLAGCWGILFLAFAGNLFSVGPGGQWFSEFQSDSSQIVEQTAECKGFVEYDGPLLKSAAYPGDLKCKEGEYLPYSSQYGLQARAVAFFAPAKGDFSGYYHSIKMLLAAAMALLFTFLIVKVSRLFNRRVAIVVLALVVVSPWLVAFARNMYWVTFLLFAPFIVGFVWYQDLKTKRRLLWFYAGIGILFFLKLLSGYEHITVMIISALVPIIYYELQDTRKTLLGLWRQGLLIGGLGVVAFAGAFLMNVASLSEYYGSWQKALSVVSSRAQSRSTGFVEYQSRVVPKLKATAPATYTFLDALYPLEVLKNGEGHPVKYAAISTVNYLMLPAVSLPITIKGFLGELVQSVLAVGALSFLMLGRIIKSKVIPKKLGRALKYSYAIGAVGAASWIVLMPGHSYVHPHLNGIIFYLPFLLVCYMIIGIFSTNKIGKNGK